MAGLESLNGLFFGHFVGAGLDHHDAVLAAGDDQIETAVSCAAQSVGLITILAVDQADADAGDGLLERHLRQRQRRRRAA